MLLQTVQTANWVWAWPLDGSRLKHDTNTESSVKLHAWGQVLQGTRSHAPTHYPKTTLWRGEQALWGAGQALWWGGAGFELTETNADYKPCHTSKEKYNLIR